MSIRFALTAGQKGNAPQAASLLKHEHVYA